MWESRREICEGMGTAEGRETLDCTLEFVRRHLAQINMDEDNQAYSQSAQIMPLD